jgi:hypothetical protein
MDEIDLGSEACEEAGFLARGIAAADDSDGHIAVEGAVTDGAGGDAVANKFALPGKARPFCRSPRGDDECAGL